MGGLPARGARRLIRSAGAAGPGRATRLIRVTGVVATVLATLAAVQVALALPVGYDLEAYRLAAQHLRQGVPLYPGPSDTLGRAGEFRYLPLVAVAFLPLTALPVEVARWIWSTALFVLALVLGRGGTRALPWAVRPWAIAGLVFFLPVVLEVALGNLNLVTLAFCVAAWRCRDRAPAAGALLAVAVGLKLLPLALVLFYVGARRWRVLGWAAAIGLIGLVIMLALMPDQLADYVRSSQRLLGDQDWVRPAIDRPGPEWLAAVFWNAQLPRILAAAVAVGALAAGHASRTGGGRATTLHHLTLATMGYLAPFGFFWTTFLVLALPLLGDVLRRSLAIAAAPLRAVALAVLFGSWLLMQVQALHDLVPIFAHLVGTLTLGTLALVLLAARPGSGVALDGDPDGAPAAGFRRPSTRARTSRPAAHPARSR